MIGTRAKRPAGNTALAFGLLVATLLVSSLLAARPAHAATFTVNRAGDAPDANINNAACDVNLAAAGSQCTLRAAIQEANDTLGADIIRFNIGGTAAVKTISPASPLPTITDAVTINGYTQAGANQNTLAEGNDAVLKVQLNGTNAGAGTNGLTVEAAECTIRGLAINRFAENGILLSGPGTTGSKVEGNFIGTGPGGAAAAGNRNGVLVTGGASDATIGGTAAGARNVISGNGLRGVEISGSGTTGNEVSGNYIGTNAAGTNALGNTINGVLIIDGATNNIVGGTTSGARNVISGNDSDGVLVSRTTGNRVEGNFIGTNAAGSGALGNRNGVLVTGGASDVTIGGTATGARNVISGNDSDGVTLAGLGGNEVLGNFIGTNAPGTADLGNGSSGVFILGASDNAIGGTAGAARNVISGNDENGVEIKFSGATNNEVVGNFIGTDAAGSADLGNSGHGVLISDEQANTVGGTVAGARNLISGNGFNGVRMEGSRATRNAILGNFIGTDAAGNAPLGNSGNGVHIVSGASGNTVGTGSGAGNRIAFNVGDGVTVFSLLGDSTGNRILSNSIHSNGQSGIDLGADNVTANDVDDPDTGENDLQNFPVVTSAVRSNSTGFTVISGTLNSNPDRTFGVQCFVAAPDPSGHGEGRILLAQRTVTTDANGDGSFTCVSPVPVAGQAVTATATDRTTGDTSEFSRNVGVVPGP